MLEGVTVLSVGVFYKGREEEEEEGVLKWGKKGN